MNLESVLGEFLQHNGIKRNVLLTNRTGSTMNVNFEGCGNGSMIVFPPDGNCKNCEKRGSVLTK